ncbi:MAG: hypothetical protein V5A59_02820 [Bacteroidales bacterium]
MLKTLALIIVGMMFAIPSFSQEEEEVKLDTIYMLGQTKKLVKVRGIFYSNVKYKEPGDDEVKNMKTKNIQKIIFNNGRKEVFNDPLVEDITETDWRNVVFTENKEEVEGMYKVGEVTGKSSSQNRTPQSAERTAKIRMKKRAANRGGVMVLVTKTEKSGGFGEVPTYYMEGIAYSFEEPEKE